MAALADYMGGIQMPMNALTSASSFAPSLGSPSTLTTVPSSSSPDKGQSFPTDTSQDLPPYITVSRTEEQSRIAPDSRQSTLRTTCLAGYVWLSTRLWMILGWQDHAYSAARTPQSLATEALAYDEIPQYVFEYAPYVHLFSDEQFWPCDIADHLVHTMPALNYTPVENMKDDRTLHNLAQLNQFGFDTYLTSRDDVESRPEWLGGSQNIPESSRGAGKRDGKIGPGGHSTAPAILVVIPKENGIVDAFWFFFYSYNLGNKVMNVRFGNHVGDWEHTLVRFRDGKPDLVFLSEHSGGEAYAYTALEKIGKRPVVYSAEGSHAMYSTPGLHPYVLPLGLLHDQTDRGPLWDPSLNLHAYNFDPTNGRLVASTQTPRAPISWFFYIGRWGDHAYPMSDHRQYNFAGQKHYEDGPLGPRFKRLRRKSVCQSDGPCHVRYWLPPLGGEIKEWPGNDMTDDGGDDFERPS